MSNENNRIGIVLAAAAVIVVTGVVIFLAWAEPSGTAGRIKDFAQYLDDHRDNAGRLILTLGGLVVIVLALLLIIVELAPQEETRELKVQQAGTTTIVPAGALRQRLEEALVTLPSVTAASARVWGTDKGIATGVDLTLTPGTNVGLATQEATRMVVDTVQTDLGLPVAAPPEVRIAFGPPQAEPVASSVVQAPEEESVPELVTPYDPQLPADQLEAFAAAEEPADPLPAEPPAFEEPERHPSEDEPPWEPPAGPARP